MRSARVAESTHSVMSSRLFPASVTELGWGLFDGCSDDLVVYCEENSEAWKYCQRNHIRSMTSPTP